MKLVQASSLELSSISRFETFREYYFAIASKKEFHIGFWQGKRFMVKQTLIINMELTLENLIVFFKKEYPYDLEFAPQTEIREYCSTDGIAAVYLLEELEKEFNVTFKNFNFHQYFLDESELSTMTWKALFKPEKQREIKEELTVQRLFDYMIKNCE